MKQKILYWIRGNKENPEGARKALKQKYIVADVNVIPITSPNMIFFGCKGQRADYATDGSPVSEIVKDCGVELQPVPSFKDGDFIVSENNSGKAYGIFKSYHEGEHYGGCMDFYVCKSIGGNIISVNDMMCGEGWRIATFQEKRRFLNLMHKCGKGWDAENKRVIDCETEETFHPFDHVIVRANDSTTWVCGSFSHYLLTNVNITIDDNTSSLKGKDIVLTNGLGLASAFAEMHHFQPWMEKYLGTDIPFEKWEKPNEEGRAGNI